MPFWSEFMAATSPDMIEPGGSCPWSGKGSFPYERTIGSLTLAEEV